MKFLQELPLTDEEKEKISRLAINTPADLYGLISSSLDEFEAFFGNSRTYHLIRHLYPLLSEEEKSKIFNVNALEIKKKIFLK